MSYTVTLTDNPYLAVLTPPVRSLSVWDRARFALHYAVLAPSVHNTQPWRWTLRQKTAADGSVRGATYELLADFGRGLPALDGRHRQLTISCGASLAALRAGLEELGLRYRVRLLPDQRRPDLLARVHVFGDLAPGDPARLGHLAEQLPDRRTYRGPMTGREPSAAQRRTLAAQARAEGATLTWVAGAADRRAVERLVALAALQQGEGGAVDEEIRLWSDHDARSHDGVPPANWQRTSVQAVMAPVVQRDFALGRPLPGDRPDVLGAGAEPLPALAVLTTVGDDPASWLATGAALMRVLLRAAADELAVGYVNQPTEVPAIRAVLADQIARLLPPSAGAVVPQLVLRIGYPASADPPAAPRRPAATVLLP
jgi:nitroreductase